MTFKNPRYVVSAGYKTAAFSLLHHMSLIKVAIDKISQISQQV